MIAMGQVIESKHIVTSSMQTSVPTYEELMLPALRELATFAQPVHIREFVRHMVSVLQMSEDAAHELLPSGKQTKIHNRVSWALWYMAQAGLVETPKRGLKQITEEGKSLLARGLSMIDNDVLRTYAKFNDRWQEMFGDDRAVEHIESVPPELSRTPDEEIEIAAERLQASLIADVRSQLDQLDSYRFEHVVLDVLKAMGYGRGRMNAGEVTQRSNDEGIDGVINEDKLGLDVIYVQAKKWSGNVGRPDVQAFVGALAGKQANKGVMIATSGFAKSAYEYAQAVQQKVILIDGARLAELMIEHNVGVSVARTIDIKRIDSDYFEG